jgi:hypothetical protein
MAKYYITFLTKFPGSVSDGLPSAEEYPIFLPGTILDPVNCGSLYFNSS